MDTSKHFCTVLAVAAFLGLPAVIPFDSPLSAAPMPAVAPASAQARPMEPSGGAAAVPAMPLDAAAAQPPVPIKQRWIDADGDATCRASGSRQVSSVAPGAAPRSCLIV